MLKNMSANLSTAREPLSARAEGRWSMGRGSFAFDMIIKDAFDIRLHHAALAPGRGAKPCRSVLHLRSAPGLMRVYGNTDFD